MKHHAELENKIFALKQSEIKIICCKVPTNYGSNTCSVVFPSTRDKCSCGVIQNCANFYLYILQINGKEPCNKEIKKRKIVLNCVMI